MRTGCALQPIAIDCTTEAAACQALGGCAAWLDCAAPCAMCEAAQIAKIQDMKGDFMKVKDIKLCDACPYMGC